MDESDDALARDTLEQLVAEHWSVVLGHAVRLTGGDRATAEDVVQETFVRAWHHIDRMTDDYGSVRSWLLRVAHNVAVDGHRRRRADLLPDADLETHLVPGRDVSDDVVLLLVVQDALSRLDHAHRVVLEAMYLYDRTVADVAHQLDVPVGTVKSRAFYALRRLRAILAEESVPCPG